MKKYVIKRDVEGRESAKKKHPGRKTIPGQKTEFSRPIMFCITSGN